jgi:cobalt/nickel transport system permease protein
VSGSHSHALHYHGHSPVHALAPEVKLVGLFVFVVSVVATPPQAVWAFSLHAVVLLGVLGLSTVPLGFFLKRLSIDLPFVLFALFLPLVGADPRVEVGPFSFSEPGLLAAWSVLAKATLGAGASVLLVATTETAALLAGLRRLRLPGTITSIASFMIRYLEVVAGELRRTRISMAARGYKSSWVAQLRPLAMAAGAIFIRAFERGERVHQAMLARGFRGDMPALEPQTEARWWPALLPALASVGVAVAGIIAS